MSSSALVQQLFSHKRYDTKAESVAKKISQQTLVRHYKWLISKKYLIDQADVDTVLSLESEYCDPVIFEEKDRITENQRILLQCERQKVIERREKLEERQQILDKVVMRVALKTEKLMIEKLNKMEVEKLLWGFPDFAYFTSFAYSAGLNFSKLGTLTTLSRSLTSSVTDLVGDVKFCERLGRQPKHTNDPKMAIGIIGIENCRRLFPILMARPLLKWADRNIKAIAPKMWQQLVVTANVTRLRLQEIGYKEPDEGVLIGTVRSLAQFSACNYFSQIFEDALVSVMQECRDNEDMESYFACSEVKPTLSVLPSVIYKLDRQLTAKIVEHIKWEPHSVHLKNAISEDLADTPILQRSLHGAALAQARAFAIYDLMDRSSAFVTKHTPYWFANVQMDGALVKKLRSCNPGKLTLSM